MALLSFGKASNRNTQAYSIGLGPHQFFISYETIVAYKGPLGYVRRVNEWGPTTGKHLSEMGFGRGVNCREVDGPAMEALIDEAVMQTGLAMAKLRFGVHHEYTQHSDAGGSEDLPVDRP